MEVGALKTGYGAMSSGRQNDFAGFQKRFRHWPEKG